MEEAKGEGKKEDDIKTLGYSGFGQYMTMKQEKLRKQLGEGLTQYSTIFAGLTLHINGRTTPPLHELRDMIIQHGGAYEQYYGSRVTHMIAAMLPDTKIRQLGRDEMVVKPEWITDSIREGKLLPVDSYRLYGLRDVKQRTLEQSILNNNKDLDSEGVQEMEQEEEDPTPFKASVTDCNDPNFLSSYYRSSRLHHLSTWREDLKVLATSLMADKKEKGKETPPSDVPRIIMHVDMDCFFVSVSARGRPELIGKALAVTHATLKSAETSSSDLASCNYEARKYGIRNGMYIRSAMKLCPELILLPYDFDAYQEVACDLYRVLAEFAGEMQAVSCDEAFLDVTSKIFKGGVDLLEYARRIRLRVKEMTGCDASIGIGSNILLARLATKMAKPNGQFHLVDDQVEIYMEGILLSDIPGIGWSHEEKLTSLGFKTCGDLQKESLGRIQDIFGPKLGQTIYDRIRGIDDRPLETTHDRKSVGSDINWAIRFNNANQAHTFIKRLSNVVFEKQESLKLRGHKVQLKVLKRKPKSGEPHKHLGCGSCDAFNRSKNIPNGVSTVDILQSECISMYNALAIPPLEVRGVGIFIHDLREACTKKGPDLLGLLQKQHAQHESVDLVDAVLDRLGYQRKVFDELPEDVKNEIINGPLIESRKRPASPRKSPVKQHSDIKKSDITSFFQRGKTVQIETVIPDGIDRQVFESLPMEIRREVLEQYQREKRVLKNESKVVLPLKINNTIPLFKGLNGIDEIRSWIRQHSVDYQSIDELHDYLLLLVKEEYCSERISLILSYLKYIYPDNEKIRSCIENVQVSYLQKYKYKIKIT